MKITAPYLITDFSKFFIYFFPFSFIFSCVFTFLFYIEIDNTFQGIVQFAHVIIIKIRVFSFEHKYCKLRHRHQNHIVCFLFTQFDRTLKHFDSLGLRPSHCINIVAFSGAVVRLFAQASSHVVVQFHHLSHQFFLFVLVFLFFGKGFVHIDTVFEMNGFGFFWRSNRRK